MHTDTGRLRPGDQLYTVRELAVGLGVNFNTVARAYRLLGASGLVSTRQGRGTFVLHGAATGRARRATLRLLASSYVDEARRLGVTEAQIAGMVARQLRRQSASTRTGENHE